jgi:DNA-directed RNA polymerase alpha subunit
MREPIIREDASEDTPKPQPSASGAGRRGPPTAIGAGMDRGDDDQFVKRYNMAIEDLDLSMRAYNCLRRSGIMMVGQILERTEEELLGLRNFGRRSYDELRDKLDEMGILPAPPPGPAEPL